MDFQGTEKFLNEKYLSKAISLFKSFFFNFLSQSSEDRVDYF